MLITVLASGSQGNCYLLTEGSESLIIECGIEFPKIKQALDFDISNVRGCLLTHEHKDHSKGAAKLMQAGIDLYTSQGTAEAAKLTGHRLNIIKPLNMFKIGGYTILPFDTQHDSAEPLGFLIKHGQNKILFATDTYYLKYNFPDLTCIMIECNFDEETLEMNIEAGIVPESMRDRLYKSHFSLQRVKQFLAYTDLKKVKSIVLLHLSETNSYAKEFVEIIADMTFIGTYAATPGLEIQI